MCLILLLNLSQYYYINTSKALGKGKYNLWIFVKDVLIDCPPLTCKTAMLKEGVNLDEYVVTHVSSATTGNMTQEIISLHIFCCHKDMKTNFA